ncbi:MAG: hypothetical protein PHC29_05100 [Candidatus Omnitrophica bacterium]|nr:hypothetical protein [Candidatus Omnitrophota bacterium]
MLPDIGLIVGSYVITRMVLLFSKESNGAMNPTGLKVAQVLGFITIVITVLCLFDLLSKGSSISSMPSFN